MNDHKKIDPNLLDRHCKPCTASTMPLSQGQINLMLSRLANWQQNNQLICKSFDFQNFHQTMSFVNAVAWVANQEDHHPELKVSYSKCEIEFTTHAIKGLSENDFICAAKVDALLKS